MNEIEKLYDEILEREKYLKSLEKTEENEYRLSELNLCIIRIQQIILKKFKIETE